jgi:hypothetical protein
VRVPGAACGEAVGLRVVVGGDLDRVAGVNLYDGVGAPSGADR